MLSEEERVEYLDLEESKWTMSGPGPDSEERNRRVELREKMWDYTTLEEIFDEGEVTVPKFNRKDPYEDIGYQGMFNVEVDKDDWDESMTYMPSFDLDYRDQILEVEAGDTTHVVQEGEEVTDIRTAGDLKETVVNYLQD